MKAWTLTEQAPVEQRPLKLGDVARPRPGDHEILVRVRACGICRTDLHVVEGDLPLKRPSVVPGHQVVGEVVSTGPSVDGYAPGDRVGIAWLSRTCGQCRFCVSDRENLCEHPRFTGWTVDGGYATMMTAPASFTYRLPERFDDLQAAPLLCAGIIGYRAIRLTGIDSWAGTRLGIYGFGAAGHVAIQVARARGAEVYVFTRDERHRALASELGAAWVGGDGDAPPLKLDTAIIFAPAGRLVPEALGRLDRGGTLVLGGIHMSDIPSMPYELLYGERVVRTVANNTREDGRKFLDEAARIGVKTRVQTFPFEKADEALLTLKNDAIRGAGVLTGFPDES